MKLKSMIPTIHGVIAISTDDCDTVAVVGAENQPLDSWDIEQLEPYFDYDIIKIEGYSADLQGFHGYHYEEIIEITLKAGGSE